MKYSRQRELIYKAVHDTTQHPTADMVYSELKEKEPSLSLATVYRNLNQLAGMGILKKFSVAGKDRFDARIDNHYHIICKTCGKVVDIENSIPLDEMLSKSYSSTGFTVDSIDILINGECGDCSKNK